MVSRLEAGMGRTRNVRTSERLTKEGAGRCGQRCYFMSAVGGRRWLKTRRSPVRVHMEEGLCVRWLTRLGTLNRLTR